MFIAVSASRLRVHFGIDLLSVSTAHRGGPGVGTSSANREPHAYGERLGEEGVHRDGVERPRAAQRPREGPAPLGETQAFDIGVHPRTSTWIPTPRVRD